MMSVCDYCGENGECHQGRWYALGNEHKEAERAVIEAAEAAKESLIYYVGDTGSDMVGQLLDALDALQATRAPIPLDKVKTWEGE